MDLVKNSAIILGLKWLILPIEFILAALIARSVGPDGKGILIILAGIASCVSMISNLRLEYGAIFYYKRKLYTLGEITGVCLIISTFFISIVLLLFSNFSDNFINLFLGETEVINFDKKWVWIPLIGLVPTLLFSFGETLFISDSEMKLYGIKHIVTSVMGLVLTYFLALNMNLGILGVLWAQFITKFINAAFPIYWLVKKKAYKTIGFTIKSAKSIFPIGLQQYALEKITMVSKRFDVFYIAAVLSVKEVGYFAIALAVFQIFKTVPRGTMWPIISKLVDDDDTKIKKVGIVCRVQFTAIMITSCIFFFYIPKFIILVYGVEFSPATDAVQFILPAVVTIPIIMTCNAYLISKGKPGKAIIPNIISTILQIIICAVLVPIIGIKGAAIGFSVNNTAYCIMLLYIVSFEKEINIVNMLLMKRNDWLLISNKFKNICKFPKLLN